MTNEEQNIAVAEFLGKKWHQPTPAEFDTGSYYQYAPDYGNDLNAMHEAEAELKYLPDRRKNFSKSLLVITIRDAVISLALEPGEPGNFWRVSHATASQRREALLKTIGKWKD